MSPVKKNLTIVLLSLFVGSLFAQPDALQKLIASNSYSLRLEENRLAGEGAELILYEISRSDFFLVGEDRGLAEIPKITAAIYLQAFQMGLRFNHVAIQTSSGTAAKLQEIAGDANAVEQMRLYLPALKGPFPQYGYKEEFEFLRQVMARAESREYILWGVGLDPLPNTQLMFRELAPFAVDDKAKKTLLKYQKAAEKEEQKIAGLEGLFLIKAPETMWEELALVFPAETEGAILLDRLKTRTAIYKQSLDSSRLSLVQNMTQGFMRDEFKRYYGLAEEESDKSPKVLIKMEGSLLSRGKIGLSSVESFGKYVQDFALEKGKKTFHVWMMAGTGLEKNMDGNASTERPENELSLLFKAVGEGTKVVDLRPVKAKLQEISSVPPSVAQIIREYDALIIHNTGTAQTPFK